MNAAQAHMKAKESYFKMLEAKGECKSLYAEMMSLFKGSKENNNRIEKWCNQCEECGDLRSAAYRCDEDTAAVIGLYSKAQDKYIGAEKSYNDALYEYQQFTPELDTRIASMVFEMA